MFLKRCALVFVVLGIVCSASQAEESKVNPTAPKIQTETIAPGEASDSSFGTITFFEPVTITGAVQTIQHKETSIFVSQDQERAAFLWDAPQRSVSKVEGATAELASESTIDLKPNIPYFVLHSTDDYVWLGGYRGIFVLPQKFISELGPIVSRSHYEEF